MTSGVLIADTHLMMQCCVDYGLVPKENGMKKLSFLLDSWCHAGVTVCLSVKWCKVPPIGN